MCHHRSYDRRTREVEPRGTPAGPIRVADADRERVADLLRGHAAAGRIDTHELEERLERAYAARYGSELDAVLAELPSEPAPRAPRRAAAPLPLLPIAAVGILVALAAVTGTWWLMWLIWPILVALGPRRRYRRAGF